MCRPNTQLSWIAATANRALPQRSTPTVGDAGYCNSARAIIEDLDSSQFGAPSFSPQTIAPVSQALDEVQALPQPMADDCTRAIAAEILKVAAAEAAVGDAFGLEISFIRAEASARGLRRIPLSGTRGRDGRLSSKVPTDGGWP
jgi:hypothetical protein